MKPGWRVFAGAAAAVAVWTLGLCAWALVTRGAPTFDLGPTVALEAPETPEAVDPGPLPSAAGTPADVPPDVPEVPAPTATGSAAPTEPAPPARTTAAAPAPTVPATPPAPAAPAVPTVPTAAPAAPAAPSVTGPTSPARASGGWDQTARQRAGQPAGTPADAETVDGTEQGDGTRDGRWWDGGTGCADESSTWHEGHDHDGWEREHDGWTSDGTDTWGDRR